MQVVGSGPRQFAAGHPIYDGKVSRASGLREVHGVQTQAPGVCEPVYFARDTAAPVDERTEGVEGQCAHRSSDGFTWRRRT